MVVLVGGTPRSKVGDVETLLFSGKHDVHGMNPASGVIKSTSTILGTSDSAATNSLSIKKKKKYNLNKILSTLLADLVD